MQSNITVVEEKLEIQELFSEDIKTLTKAKNIVKEKKLAIVVTQNIDTTIRPKVIELDTTNVSSNIKGRLITDNTKPILGVATQSSLSNQENVITTYGIIEDNGLLGATLNQKVYSDISNGNLSLAVSGLAIGIVLTTTVPIKVLINPSREYEETQQVDFIDNRDMYYSLRYLSYFLPLKYSTLYANGTVAILRYYANNIFAYINEWPWPNNTIAWSCITYGDVNNGTFVAVSFYSGVGQNERFAYSNDGTNWTLVLPPQNNTWQFVTYGAGLFVAVSSDGTNRVATSPDGITWTLRTASQANSWKSIAYGAGLFVAVSSDGTNRVMTSPDGINWTNRNASQANQWQKVIFGDNLFVAISSDGTNRVMTSPDGINWTNRVAPLNTWTDIAYGNGFYFVNGGGSTMYSIDGIIWKLKTTSAFINSNNNLFYAEGVFYSYAGTGADYSRTAEI